MQIIYDKKTSSLYKEYFPIMKAISGQFGNQCEVVIYHVTKDITDASVHAIIGNVTGRELYTPITRYISQIVESEGEDVADQIGYISYYQGKPFRCSAIFIRNEDRLMGCLGIYYCVQDFFALKTITEQLTTNRSVLELKSEAKEMGFAHNINDFVEHTFESVIDSKGVDLRRLSKAERTNLVGKLEKTGIFSVKGTIENLARQMQVSKYTIYNDIEGIKTNKNNKGEDNNEKKSRTF